MPQRQPGRPLQRAWFSTLREDLDLAALMGEAPRVYDRVPAGAALPYIQIGDIQLVDDSHCEAAWEAFVTTHVWSEAVGKPQAQEIADLVGALFHEAALDLGDDFVCVLAEFRDARIFTESDGLTTHGVLTHRVLIDQAATE